MNIAREDVMTALAALVGGALGLTVGRRVLMWSKVTAQPACFIRNIGDIYGDAGQIMVPVTMHCEVWIYARADGPDVAAGPILNGLVDTLEAAFASYDPASNRLTLGGLVQDCRLEGDSVFDPGDLDGQAKAVIPVKIDVPWARMWKR